MINYPHLDKANIESDLQKNYVSNKIINDNKFIKNKPQQETPNVDPRNIQGNDIYIKDFFSPYYFSNLNNNFPYNIKGSCSYVSVSMLLSFYDTYWNDNFIPDKYESTSEVVENKVLNLTDSPGVKNEKDINILKDNYSNTEVLSMAIDYHDTILQMDLLSLGIIKYDIYDSSSIYSCATLLSTMVDITYDYFLKSTSLTNNDINIIYDSSNSNQMRNTIVNKVKQGIPVVVSASNYKGTHAFIVYDYDEQNDELYGHFGWQSEEEGPNPYTHISLSKEGYGTFHEIFYFEPNISHSHSNNFHAYDENDQIIYICPCTSVIPTYISQDSNYLDVLPTYSWGTLIKEKWFDDIELHHNLYILNHNDQIIYEKNNIYDNKYTLTYEEYSYIFSIPYNEYYIYVGLESNDSSFWDDDYCCEKFNKPNRYYYKTSILPSDWGFIGRYYFANELTEEYLINEPERKNTVITMNDLTITTNRLRCGYIENSYIVLSPRRENAGRAFFEMEFDVPVYSFMYRACMWSNSENLDGIAIIQVKDEHGNWTTLKDIPISSLSSKENGLKQFIESTPNGIYGLRFETTATAVGTRNKGRLCIDDIVFNTSNLNFDYVDFDYSTKIN